MYKAHTPHPVRSVSTASRQGPETHYLAQTAFLQAPHGHVRLPARPIPSAHSRTLAWLSYLGLGFSAWFIFRDERHDSFVCFHALQSLCATFAFILLEMILLPLPSYNIIGGLLGICAFLGWLALLFSSYRGLRWHIPLLGPLVEQLVRQRIG